MLGKISATDSLTEVRFRAGHCGCGGAALHGGFNLTVLSKSNRFARQSVFGADSSHTSTADSFSCSRAENPRGDRACNRAFSSIRCFVFSQHIFRTGGSRSCFIQGLNDWSAWFTCMKTIFTPAKLSTAQTWLRSFSDHLRVPLAFLHSTLHGIYCPSTISAYLSFTSEYLYFNIPPHWSAAQGPTVSTLLSLTKTGTSDPENHLRQPEKPSEWHQ